MFKKKMVYVVVMVLWVISACDKENVDTTNPTIEILRPQDHAVYEPGTVIHLTAVLRDNVQLGSYKIEVHVNNDGHGHGRKLDAGEPWTHFETGNIEPGVREFTLSREILVPFNAAHGEYHLGVYCSDAAGNETAAFVEIEVEQEH